MKKFYLFFTIISSIGYSLPAQSIEISSERLYKSLGELYDLLSIPNDAHFPKQVAANLAYMQEAFTKRNFSVRKLETATSPLLLATRTYPGNTHTALIYLQVDGQPIDPSCWNQEDPFIPALKKSVSGLQAYEELPWESLKGEIDPEWRIFVC